MLYSVNWLLNLPVTWDWLSHESAIYLLCILSALAYITGIVISPRQSRLGLYLIGFGTLGLFLAILKGTFFIFLSWDPTVPFDISLGISTLTILGIFVLTAGLALYSDAKDLMTLAFVVTLAVGLLITGGYFGLRPQALPFFLFLALSASILKQWRGWTAPFLICSISPLLVVSNAPYIPNIYLGLYLIVCQLLFVGPALLRFRNPAASLSQSEFWAYAIASIGPFLWWGGILQSRLWMSTFLLGCILLIIILGFLVSRKHPADTLKGTRLWMVALLSVEAFVGGVWMVYLLSVEAYIASVRMFGLTDSNPLGSHVLENTLAWFTAALAAVIIAQFLYQSPRLARWFVIFYVLAIGKLILDHTQSTYNPHWDDPYYWSRLIAFVSTALATSIVWYGWKSDPNHSKNDIRPYFLLGASVVLGVFVLWDTVDILI
jgi:hypothetical protein